MPLFEYLCLDCGELSKILIIASSDKPQCQGCGSANLKKLLSAHASMSGSARNHLPGCGDMPGCTDGTGCGSTPAQAGCAGPGSCCGKSH